jgi:hypothetical protein
MHKMLKALTGAFKLTKEGMDNYRRFRELMTLIFDWYNTNDFQNLVKIEEDLEKYPWFDKEPTEASGLEEVKALAITIADLCDALTNDPSNWAESSCITAQELITRLNLVGVFRQRQIAEWYALSVELDKMISGNDISLHGLQHDVQVYANQLEACPITMSFWLSEIALQRTVRDFLFDEYELIDGEDIFCFSECKKFQNLALKGTRGLLHNKHDNSVEVPKLTGTGAVCFMAIYRVFLNFFQRNDGSLDIYNPTEVWNAIHGKESSLNTRFKIAWNKCSNVYQHIVHEILPTKLQYLMNTDPQASAQQIILLAVDVITSLFDEQQEDEVVHLMIYMMAATNCCTFLGPAINAIEESIDRTAFVKTALRSMQFFIDDRNSKNDVLFFLYRVPVNEALQLLPGLAKIMFTPM